MTPHEPDRFEAKARVIYDRVQSTCDLKTRYAIIADALRAEREAAARVLDGDPRDTITRDVAKWLIIMQKRIRALKPDPAPAPAASAEEIRAAQRTAVYPADIEEAARMHAAYDAAAEAAAVSEALERAAQIADRYKSGVAVLIADSIRDQIPPAAAPAAETGKAPAPDLLAALQIACWAMCGKDGPEHIVACGTLRTAIAAPAQAAEALRGEKERAENWKRVATDRFERLTAAEARIAELEAALDKMQKMARDNDLRYFEDIARVADGVLAARATPQTGEARICDNCKRAAKAKDGRTDRGIPIGPCYCDTLRAPQTGEGR